MQTRNAARPYCFPFLCFRFALLGLFLLFADDAVSSPCVLKWIGCVAMLFSLLSWLPIHSGHSVRNQDYSSSSQLQNEKHAPAHGINNRAVPPRRTKRELLFIWIRPCHHAVRGKTHPSHGLTRYTSDRMNSKIAQQLLIMANLQALRRQQPQDYLELYRDCLLYTSPSPRDA